MGQPWWDMLVDSPQKHWWRVIGYSSTTGQWEQTDWCNFTKN